jgi:hypothetical protein
MRCIASGSSSEMADPPKLLNKPISAAGGLARDLRGLARPDAFKI